MSFSCLKSVLPCKGKLPTVAHQILCDSVAENFPAFLFYPTSPAAPSPLLWCTSHTKLFVVPQRCCVISHVAFSSLRTQLLNFSWKPSPVTCPTGQNCPLITVMPLLCPTDISNSISFSYCASLCVHQVLSRKLKVETIHCSSLSPLCLAPCLAQSWGSVNVQEYWPYE